jgi:hypothetical protein
MDEYDVMWHKMTGAIVSLLALGYVALLVEYPVVGAGIALLGVVLGTGLFTAKVVFRMEDARLIWSFTPIFGTIWLSFFWLLWCIQALL